MQKRQEAVANPSTGKPISGATVTVTQLSGGAAATIYTGNGTGLISGNTVTTDSNGRYSYYAADGRYSESISGTGLTTTIVTDILLEDPADGSAALSASSGASLIGFVQSGTGAIQEDLQSRGRWVINLTDFMTDAQRADVRAGTALLDVSAAVQAAFTRAQAIYDSGGRVKLLGPAGKYRLGTTINVGTTSLLELIFLGEGVAATQFLYYGANGTDGFVFGRSDSPAYNILKHSEIGGFTVIRMSGTGGKGVNVRQVAFCNFHDIVATASGLDDTGGSSATSFPWAYAFFLWDWPGAGYFQTIWSQFRNIVANGATATAFYAGTSNAGNHFENIFGDVMTTADYAITEKGFWNTWVKVRVGGSLVTVARGLGGFYFAGGAAVKIVGLEAESGAIAPKANIIVNSTGTLRISNYVGSGNAYRIDNASSSLIVEDSNQLGGSAIYPNLEVVGNPLYIDNLRSPKKTFCVEKQITVGLNSVDATLDFGTADGLRTGIGLQKIRVRITGADANFYVLYYRATIDGVFRAAQYPLTTIYDGVTVTNGTFYFDPVGVWEQIRVLSGSIGRIDNLTFYLRTSAASSTVSCYIMPVSLNE